MKKYKKTLIMVALSSLALMGCSSQEDAPAKHKKSVDEQIEWIDEFNAESTQGRWLFEEIETRFLENYDTLDKEQKEQALQTFVLAIESEAQKLNGVALSFIEEINQLKADYPEVNFETGDNSEKLPNGVIKGLFTDMDKMYARLIKQDNGQHIVGIDFDRLLEHYEEDMSPATLNRIAIVEFEQENSLMDYENGHIDFETVWEALDLVESLDSETEELFLQNEWARYFYYHTFLGYEEITMEDGEGNLNKKAVQAMEALAKKHPGTDRAEDLSRIVASIKEEGFYGEQTHLVADDIFEQRFGKLLDGMETEMNADQQATGEAEEEIESDNGAE